MGTEDTGKEKFYSSSEVVALLRALANAMGETDRNELLWEVSGNSTAGKMIAGIKNKGDLSDMNQKGKDDACSGQTPVFDQVDGQRRGNSSPKKMMNRYQASYETIQAGLKQPKALFDTFMLEADLMKTYKGYGEHHREEISHLCSSFKKAFAENDIDRMVDLYDDLEAMKIKNQPKRPVM